MRRLVKHERPVDQNIVAENLFDGIQQRIMSDQAIGPFEKQMQSVESFQRLFAAVTCKRLDRPTEKKHFLGGKHWDGEYNTVPLVTIKLLLGKFSRHIYGLCTSYLKGDSHGKC